MSDPIGYNGSYIDPAAFSRPVFVPPTDEVPTPAEMLAEARAHLEPLVQAEIAHVLAAMRKLGYRGQALTVSAGTADENVRRVVMERFRAKGWEVKTDSAQRDGAWYEFRSAKRDGT